MFIESLLWGKLGCFHKRNRDKQDMINSMCHQENQERCGKECLGWIGVWNLVYGCGADPLRGSA